MDIKAILMMSALITQNMSWCTPVSVPGTSLWLIVNNIEAMTQNADNLVDTLTEMIDGLGNQEQVLRSMFDFFATQTTETQEILFNNAQLMQSAALNIITELQTVTDSKSVLDDKMNSLVDVLQSITTESSDILYAILDTVDIIEELSLVELDQLAQQSQTIDMLVAQIDSQADIIEQGLSVVVNNQKNIISTLNVVQRNGVATNQALNQQAQNLSSLTLDVNAQTDLLEQEFPVVIGNQKNIQLTLNTVRHNGIVANQAIAALSESTAFINAKLDLMFDEIALEWTELQDNDALIFSIIEQLDAQITGGFRSLQTTIASNEAAAKHTGSTGVRHITKDDFLSGCSGFAITESGVYQLSDSLTLEASICIQGSMITLDLDGNALSVATDDIIPLQVDQGSYITIKNGTIIGGQGVVITQAQSITLENVHIDTALNNSIAFNTVYNGSIVGCSITNGTGVGVLISPDSDLITLDTTAVSDCTGDGFDIQGSRITITDVTAHNNGGNGISVSNATDLHITHAALDGNTQNGIFVDSTATNIQLEALRVMGNGAVGCVDNGATQSNWINNLSTGNSIDDYVGIKAVAPSKATSFWYNVYGN